jgi:hypothetical protein
MKGRMCRHPAEACRKTGAKSVPIEDARETFGIGAELAWIDGGVLHERDRSLIALSGGAEQAESGLADFAESFEFAAVVARAMRSLPADATAPRV